MREPGYYWVKATRRYAETSQVLVAFWDGYKFSGPNTGDEVRVISERIPAPGEPCTCEAAQRATWRPISEWTDDMGYVMLIDIYDSDSMRYDYPDELSDIRHGWTHFAQAPSLTHEMAEKLKGGQ